MIILSHSPGIPVEITGSINLPLTLDCGQAFRWKKCADGLYRGVHCGREVTVGTAGSGLVFYGCSEEEAHGLWSEYFDLSRDYELLLARFSEDEKLSQMISQNGCLHILRQNPWEALCSFIISACNNIPRIKLIIERLCHAFGEKLNEEYSFPAAEKIASLSLEDLSVLRCGFRDKYILDAAKKCASGEIDLESLKNTDLDSARRILTGINGVGNKVADCVLLFSLGFFDAFPVDVHVRRAVEKLYPQGLPDCTSGARGLAQQYIFLSDK